MRTVFFYSAIRVASLREHGKRTTRATSRDVKKIVSHVPLRCAMNLNGLWFGYKRFFVRRNNDFATSDQETRGLLSLCRGSIFLNLVKKTKLKNQCKINGSGILQKLLKGLLGLWLRFGAEINFRIEEGQKEREHTKSKEYTYVHRPPRGGRETHGGDAGGAEREGGRVPSWCTTYNGKISRGTFFF